MGQWDGGTLLWGTMELWDGTTRPAPRTPHHAPRSEGTVETMGRAAEQPLKICESADKIICLLRSSLQVFYCLFNAFDLRILAWGL